MITIDNFKQFLGWGRPEEEAKPAIGLVILTRSSPTGTVIPILDSLVFYGGGQSFVQANRETMEINESQTMVEIPLIARNAGLAGNIPASQIWNVDQSVSFAVSNPNAFSQGAEALPARPGLFPASDTGQGYDDERVQEALDIGKAVVKQIGPIKSDVTDETLFANVLIKQAVYLVSMYALENNQVQESTGPLYILQQTAGDVRRMFKDRTWLPLLAQVNAYIGQSGFRDVDYWFDRETA